MGFVDQSDTFVRHVGIPGKIKGGFKHSSSSSVPEINAIDLKAQEKSVHGFIMNHL